MGNPSATLFNRNLLSGPRFDLGWELEPASTNACRCHAIFSINWEDLAALLAPALVDTNDKLKEAIAFRGSSADTIGFWALQRAWWIFFPLLWISKPKLPWNPWWTIPSGVRHFEKSPNKVVLGLDSVIDQGFRNFLGGWRWAYPQWWGGVGGLDMPGQNFTSHGQEKPVKEFWKWKKGF